MSRRTAASSSKGGEVGNGEHFSFYILHLTSRILHLTSYILHLTILTSYMLHPVVVTQKHWTRGMRVGIVRFKRLHLTSYQQFFLFYFFVLNWDSADLLLRHSHSRFITCLPGVGKRSYCISIPSNNL